VAEAFQEPRGRRMSAIGNHYQKTGEDCDRMLVVFICDL
jgi:hypothetical protein